MSFVCEQRAIFTNTVSLSNVVGTTNITGKLNANSIDASHINVNDLTIQSINIYDKIIDLSNNITGIIDSELSIASQNPVQNSVITNALSTKQDTIVDLSTNGLLSAGSNIFFDICYNNITINSPNTLPLAYFVCYVSAESIVENSRLPIIILFDQIARQYPTSSIVNGGYSIVESGIYWIHSSILQSGGSAFGIQITRNNVSTVVHFFSGNSMEDNSIIAECITNDIIRLVQLFGTSLTYYGTGDTTGLNLTTTLQGYKVG
jgi:hypothetical protein